MRKNGKTRWKYRAFFSSAETEKAGKIEIEVKIEIEIELELETEDNCVINKYL